MNQLEKTLTSLEVAEMVGRRHDQVMRDIENVIRHLGDHKSVESYFIPSNYENLQRKTFPCYKLTKKGCELYSTRMTGEKGTKFAVAYIERFNEMENHIKQNEIDTTQLSPELQMMNQMFQAVAKNEMELRETKQLAQETQKSVDNISNIVTLTNVDWRKKVDVVIKKIAQKWTGVQPYRSVRSLSYDRLEERAGCNLELRLNNRKERAVSQGMTKTFVKNINKLDVIAEEKRLVEIYIQIVKEMAIQFKIDINDFESEVI
ncbi:MAG TPA: Rha family transcriptional regulator [Pseudogracilibacillus sp.]|nr:Rha family transcriptional regulator [Pseudogracilibacillus sp.]